MLAWTALACVPSQAFLLKGSTPLNHTQKSLSSHPQHGFCAQTPTWPFQDTPLETAMFMRN